MVGMAISDYMAQLSHFFVTYPPYGNAMVGRAMAYAMLYGVTRVTWAPKGSAGRAAGAGKRVSCMIASHVYNVDIWLRLKVN